jgi:predicted nuclease with TOPRIM domain
MSKKLIITEEERNNIKSLYNVREQFDMETIIQGLMKKLENNFEDDETSIDSSENQQSQESDDLTNISEKGQKLLDNQTFQKKLDDISKSINIDKDSIIKLMNHESKLDPQVKNSIGCVGLIQFCPDSKNGSTKTIGGKTYNLEELRNNLDKQMDAIKEFWVTGYKSGKIKEPKDLYIYNFFPIAAGKSDDFVLKSSRLSAQKVANSNPVFNRTLGKPRNTPLTVGDLENYYKKTGMV